MSYFVCSLEAVSLISDAADRSNLHHTLSAADDDVFFPSDSLVLQQRPFDPDVSWVSHLQELDTPEVTSSSTAIVGNEQQRLGSEEKKK